MKSLLNRVVNNMRKPIPRYYLLTGGANWTFDPESISTGIAHFKPGAMVAILSSNDQSPHSDKTEWYGTPYTNIKLTTGIMSQLNTALDGNSISHPIFRIPPPNPWISPSQNIALNYSRKEAPEFHEPSVSLETKELRLFPIQEDRFATGEHHSEASI